MLLLQLPLLPLQLKEVKQDQDAVAVDLCPEMTRQVKIDNINRFKNDLRILCM
jgi:hypothetical protein